MRVQTWLVLLGAGATSLQGQTTVDTAQRRSFPCVAGDRLTASSLVNGQSNSALLDISDDIEPGPECLRCEWLFDYTPHRANQEAEMLAMELTAALRAPDAEYDRILRDLRLIRGKYPVLKSIVDTPNFVPNQLLVRLRSAEAFSGFEEMNTFYQVIEDHATSASPRTHLLTFCDNLNARVVRLEYETLAGEVSYAEPNSIGGSDRNIAISLLPEAYRYTIVHGFGDCFSGCICKRTWVIDVYNAGTVSLASYGERNISFCIYEDTACCLPNEDCQSMAIGSCLDQDGAPQAFGSICDACLCQPCPHRARMKK